MAVSECFESSMATRIFIVPPGSARLALTVPRREQGWHSRVVAWSKIWEHFEPYITRNPLFCITLVLDWPWHPSSGPRARNLPVVLLITSLYENPCYSTTVPSYWSCLRR